MTERPATPTLDSERQEKAREYARTNRKWMVVELLLSGALIVAFLVTGLSQRLKEALTAAGVTSPVGLVAAYVAIVSVSYTLILAPSAWWTGYVLPHRYGLSTQSLKGWLIDQLKMLVLSLVLGIPIAEVIYWLLRAQPQSWWIWATGFMVLVRVVLDALFPVLIVPIFYELTPLEDETLVERIRALAHKTGTRIAEVYTIDLSSRTTAANALVMGLSSTKRIALGDTLYADYSTDEIETIVAHELGHQVHHDLELGIAVQSVVMAAGMYVAHRALTWGVEQFGFEGPGDVAALPLLLLATALFSLLTMPLLNAYSRWRERKADRYALRVTGKPEAFAGAMIRLSNQNLAEVDPPRWVVWLLYSHPPIKERLTLARKEL